ncbi:glutaredoxin 2 [Zobellella maritima]|uniref:glutaredoxin 2 n=1 Tax=Zobellella maritima TaxID=2059725 RepID=UPI000E304C08|nr:glutaredoxin 2 [Zobellella maritima]
MKLYVFDHCPFCIKAMMAAGYTRLPVTQCIIDNHDVARREAMIGYNAVPILEKDDGSFMAESADIVQYLMECSGDSLAPARHAEALSHWLEAHQHTLWSLLFPRDVQLPLPEFRQPESIAYFTANKTAMLGCSFARALADSPEYIAKMEAAFAGLDWLQPPSRRRDSRLSWDDIQLFPTLRNLTMVKGLNFPAALDAYLNEVSALCRVALYRELAC